MHWPVNLCLAMLLCGVSGAPALAAEIDFAHEIVPLLRQHCGQCHTGNKKQGGLSLNTRESLLAGGESGPAAVPDQSARSELIRRVTSRDTDERMPPEGPALSAEQVALLTRWIDAGLPWQVGFAFQGAAYEPPLRPRRPELPAPRDGRSHPIDRLVDAYLVEHQRPRPAPLGDAQFLRRVSLDLIGLLPTPERRAEFLADARADKRDRFVDELLADDVGYAEHWLTFWNDLLRNDYAGTGFITGGRQQISRWLYEALVSNKPYDAFARELIAPPNAESRGFIDGIRWRGEVERRAIGRNPICAERRTGVSRHQSQVCVLPRQFHRPLEARRVLRARRDLRDATARDPPLRQADRQASDRRVAVPRAGADRSQRRNPSGSGSSRCS